jgi:hypothetical protein
MYLMRHGDDPPAPRQGGDELDRLALVDSDRVDQQQGIYRISQLEGAADILPRKMIL